MTTITIVRIAVKCPNLDCSRYGKEMGAFDVDSRAISVTDRRYCAACRKYHTQTFLV
jgi:hypothetical protein